MSGFEIAGIVLGAFPLALEALENYRNVARTFGFWWEIRYEYQKCSSELKYHRLAFGRNLKLLLLPLVADDGQIRQLLADPGGEGWKEPHVAKHLEGRLHDSYEIYLEIVSEMQRTMEKLNDELSVDKKGFQEKVTQSKRNATTSNWKQSFSKKNTEYELYRVKFSLGESNRKRLFEELQTYNERLEKLLGTSDAVLELEDKRRTGQKTSVMDKAFRSFWYYADRLYKTLAKSWNCQCSDQHYAKMMLQHRTSANLEFLLLLFYAPNISCCSSAAWSIHRTNVKVLDRPDSGETSVPIVVVSQSAALSSPSPVTVTSTPNHRRGSPVRSALRSRGAQSCRGRIPKSTVNSQLPTITLQVPPPENVSTTATINSAGSLEPSKTEITNLCQSVRRGVLRKECYAFLQDEDKRYYLYTVPSLRGSENDLTVSLDQLLRREVGPPLSRRQRYSLAMTLASSFIELHSSYWLCSPWDRSSISFFRDPQDSNAVILDTPHITTACGFPTSNLSPKFEALIADIASLGIVLLELCFGTLIDAHPARAKYPRLNSQADKSFDLLAAIEWQREIAEEAGADYANAVDWCLLGSRKVADDDNAWRQKLLQQVLQPLERCHQYLNNGIHAP